MTQPHQQVLHALAGLQQVHELSIIKISEQISATQAPNPRTSDVSDAFENPSPASLAADLSHYKELFSKLRFSYLEQVTKEKFIRSIVGDPPLIVTPAENSLLETQLLEIKAVLKGQKEEVKVLVQQLEDEGRELARLWEGIELGMGRLRDLPGEIEGLEGRCEELRGILGDGGGVDAANDNNANQNNQNKNKNLHLPLEKTYQVIHEREAELQSLDRELEMLRNSLPRKTREWERLEAELKGLEGKRGASVAGAREARRRREERLGGESGGVGDELEERGKWFRCVGRGVRDMLGVEG